MASSNVLAPENNNVSVVARQPLHPPIPFFFPHTLSPRTYYFSAPPQIYFISDINLLPPPSIWVYYPLWYINSDPNRYESIQELPQPYSPTPSRELTLPPTSSRRVFGRRSHGRCEKVTWRRSIKPEVESNGDHITTVMLRNIPNRYTCGKDELVKRFQQMTYPVEAYSAVSFSPARDGGDNTVQTTMVCKCSEPVSSV
ncbi:hypothetical protein ISN44_As11g007600 [Arabidopsis suecica]|uniref:Uncharacterized protein n=1 Tax=Arabidopsis suecica TaxID=45249 RepID=A0A8T1Z863_ARASU|nr:hypothetical protein ISN44_As11g007600 [Arabidopsis suecica]